jgi:aminoglycoside 6'-N-acetyltransferase
VNRPGITFRRLARTDLATLRRWLNTPHVYEWWGRRGGPGSLGGAGAAAATEAEVEAKYGPTIDQGGTTQRYVVECDGDPVGLIQWYHLRDFADYARAISEDPTCCAGLDVFIGEADFIGRGLGSQAIQQFVTTIVFQQPDVARAITGPAKTNSRSIRAFEKAGFRLARFATIAGEPTPEAVLVRGKS